MWKRNNLPNETEPEKKENQGISPSLSENLSKLRILFKDNDSLKIREFRTKGKEPYLCAVVYLEALTDDTALSECIIKGIMNGQPTSPASPADDIYKNFCFEGDLALKDKYDDAVLEIVSGNSVVFVDGASKVLSADTKGWKSRSISEPEGEKSLRGPKEGFTEKLTDNIAMIERRLCTPDLKIKYMKIGRRSATKIAVCYLESLIIPEVLEELYKRLEKIDIDAVLESNYLEAHIADKGYTAFKTIGSTEKPDVVTGRMLEGRIAVLTNGTPEALTAPLIFIESFQASDDYYTHYFASNIGRLLRILCFFLTISIPAIYVALLTFHKQMMPANLTLSIITARQGVPFPVIFECISLLVVFEILRETALRVPSTVAQAFSIVGAIVVGNSAIEAKLVSVSMVIIVSLTSLTGLMIPRLSPAVLVYRTLFIILAGILGLYGYIIGIFIMFTNLLSLKSFGINFLSYMVRPNEYMLQDVYVRLPWQHITKRPGLFTHNITRQKKTK